MEEGSSARLQGAAGEPKFDPSRNSLKDGLFGRVHALDDEDPDAIAAIRARYLKENEPTDAIEEFCVNELSTAHILSLRFHRAMASELGRQQRTIRKRWEEVREETASTLRGHLVAPETVDLYPIVAELRTFGHGVSYLAGEWFRLKQAINTRGFLTPEESQMGVRLMGVKPALETVTRHRDAFLWTVWNARIHPLSPKGLIATLIQPRNRPAGLEHLSQAELIPGPDAAREQISKWVDEQLVALEALADRVGREIDGPELARVLNPAAIVIDPEKIRRFDRARCTYQMMFYRGKKTLDDHRKGDAHAAGNAGRRGRAGRDENAAAPPAREPDIKPRTHDGGITAGPSSTSAAVTEVLGQQPDDALDQRADGVLQNGTEIGPERAETDHPGACRSHHKQVTKRTVGTVERGRWRDREPRRTCAPE
jgi:hypothetical protein